MPKELVSAVEEEAEGGLLKITPNPESPWGRIVNSVLEKAGRSERFCTINAVEGVVAEGIWSVEEAERIASGVTIEDRNGGRYFRVSPQDFEEVGDMEDDFVTFKVDPAVLEILLSSGIFVRKPYGYGKKFLLVYPPGYKDLGIPVEMTHRPAKNDAQGRESVTLHFLI